MRPVGWWLWVTLTLTVTMYLKPNSANCPFSTMLPSLVLFHTLRILRRQTVIVLMIELLYTEMTSEQKMAESLITSLNLVLTMMKLQRLVIIILWNSDFINSCFLLFSIVHIVQIAIKTMH